MKELSVTDELRTRGIARRIRDGIAQQGFVIRGECDHPGETRLREIFKSGCCNQWCFHIQHMTQPRFPDSFLLAVEQPGILQLSKPREAMDSHFFVRFRTVRNIRPRKIWTGNRKQAIGNSSTRGRFHSSQTLAQSWDLWL